MPLPLLFVPAAVHTAMGGSATAGAFGFMRNRSAQKKDDAETQQFVASAIDEFAAFPADIECEQSKVLLRNPQSLIGKHILVMGKGGSFFEGEVKAYDEKEDTHQVKYSRPFKQVRSWRLKSAGDSAKWFALDQICWVVLRSRRFILRPDDGGDSDASEEEPTIHQLPFEGPDCYFTRYLEHRAKQSAISNSYLQCAQGCSRPSGSRPPDWS